jgi:hypothetical protein
MILNGDFSLLEEELNYIDKYYNDVAMEIQ